MTESAAASAEPRPDRLAAVFDALDNGVIVVDRQGCIVHWNGWMTAASKITAEAAVACKLDALFSGARLGRLAFAVDEALFSGASSFLTHSLHGEILPLRTRAGRTLIHNISVRPAGEKPFDLCVVQIFDVTVATHREQVLRARQNARYAAVVDHAPDAILTVDAEGVIQIANPAAAVALGCDPADLIAHPIEDLFETPAIWREIWTGVLRTGASAGASELVALRKDGARTYMEVSASRWFDDARVLVTVILRDINERHAAEAALRRLNETLEERVATALSERKLLADVVESTEAFVQVLDMDHRFLAVNRSSADEFERVYGVRPVVGASLLELLADHPLERDTRRLLWDRALSGEAFTVVEEIGDPVRDGRAYELKFDVLRNSAGVQIAAFQFVYDVTERAQRQAQLAKVEESLRQSQKMEAIGQLTGGIAHDFNNLLTGIIGAMSLLKRRFAAGRFDDTERYMDAAIASANRAAALTHRLLAFARRQPLDPKPIDPNRFIRSIEDLLRRTLNEGVQLGLDLDPHLWPTRTDAHQLENAVLNLAINARDAMPSGGRLTISTRNLDAETPVASGEETIPPGRYVTIRVSDTGTGIAPEVLGKVFEPFFTTKPLGQGTGLGLSMIYGFVRQSGGHVGIASSPGKGTDVTLYLPPHFHPIPTETPVADPGVTAGDGEAVLLVEDDPSVRLLMGEVLRDLGYACIEAIDGQAATPILRSNARLDLMITDIGLPGMNGRQLADLARRHRPDLRVLFVTGYAEHATGDDRFLEPGMAMITKPFTLDALAAKIREVFTLRS